MTNLFCCRIRMPLEQFPGHQDKSWRAKTTLESAVLDERLLDRVQLIAGSESLDGNDFGAIHKSRQIKTPAHRDSIDERRTAAAEPLPATFTCPKKTELAAQNLEQGLVRSDLRNSRPPVQLESYGPAMRFLHQSTPKGKFCACRKARNTRSAVSGISVMRTSIASNTALPLAGQTQHLPVSPTPFAPNGPCRWGTSTSSPLISSG